ncbi:MAG: hypothetical protein MN733_25515, partial [Nitrososphaera sp.]|nr:hypothetical protein [Nitrososphaera sp.]
MTRVLRYAAGFVALIPGVGIFFNGWAAPTEYKELFGIVVETLGVLAFLLILTGKQRIAKWPDARVRNWSLFCATAFVLSL